MSRPHGMNSIQKKKWAALSSRKFVRTIFFHEPTLQSLGMAHSARKLLVNGGIGDFIGKSAPTYPSLVKEFLATIVYRPTDILFRLQGREYEMSKEQLAHIFGVTAAPTIGWIDVSKGLIEGPVQFWIDATRVPFDAHKGQYNHSFTHPSLRLCHKVLGGSFFAQAEVNKVPLKDLGYLWCLTPESPVVPNWVEMFLYQCQDIINTRSTATL